jgi:hypothetical protein
LSQRGPARVIEGMWTLIRNGGVVPMSLLMLFGLLALGAAFHFALRADRRTLGFVRSMAMATLFTTLAATAADLGATLYAASDVFDEGVPAKMARAAHMVMEGFAESTSPGIVGFSFLGLTFMLVAVGRRRLDERARAGA